MMIPLRKIICNHHSPFPPHLFLVSSNLSHFESEVINECKSGKIKKLDDALDYFDKLVAMNHLPSIVTLSHLLNSLSKIGCYSDVITRCKKMNDIGIQPCFLTLNILINCYCQLKETGYGFSLFGDLLKRGYDPDIITFTNLIRGLCLQGKIQSAVKLFDKMIERGVQLNTITCNTIITALSRVGELENALQLLRNMAKLNCEATIVSYGCFRKKRIG